MKKTILLLCVLATLALQLSSCLVESRGYYGHRYYGHHWNHDRYHHRW